MAHNNIIKRGLGAEQTLATRAYSVAEYIISEVHVFISKITKGTRKRSCL